MDIIRGEFKEVKVEGRMGLPILNEGDYLTYEGIVDRNEKEDGNENKEIGAAGAAKNIANATNNTNAASESLSMRFTVNANEEGYDLDWIKSHVDFEENTQILLENSNKRRGIEAQLSGNITLNSSMDGINANRDSGLPDIDLPGLKIRRNAEISKMKDKTKNGPIAGGFQFVKPTFSFMGVNLSDATDGLDLGGLPDDPEQEQIKDVDPKVNGFSLGITNMDLSFGRSDQRKKSVKYLMERQSIYPSSVKCRWSVVKKEVPLKKMKDWLYRRRVDLHYQPKPRLMAPRLLFHTTNLQWIVSRSMLKYP